MVKRLDYLNTKTRQRLKLVVRLITVVLLAYVLSYFFFRIDLTAEKRYTLSPYSKKVLRNLNDIVFVKVYLDGELNIPFRKMQQSLRETLDEFRIYAKDNIQYTFVNPFESTDAGLREDMFNQLYEKGLKPTNILSKDKEGGSSEKIIFPGALVSYKGVEIPVNFLKNNQGISAEENINNSIQALEFELIKVISSSAVDRIEKIAFIEGHGELDEFQTKDISNAFSWFYQVDRGKIGGQQGILDDYLAVIIAKPERRFSEQDKYVLDQYIMKGGSVMWFLDRVAISMDTLAMGSAVALINDLNLDDMLFRYGVRINPVLLQDIQCNIIPVNVALAGNSPEFKPAPWFYFPLLSAPPYHPVTRNLNMIKTEFVNTIDTIGAREGTTKTVLLKSSDFSRVVEAPLIMSLDEIRADPKRTDFRNAGLAVAVMLEGTFESVFQNRMISEIMPGSASSYLARSKPAKMLVVADGDIIRNDIRMTPQGITAFPLGFDRYTQQTFGNKDFIMNALHYLTGNEDLVNLRSRDITLRLLDKARIKEERALWVIINTILPVMMIIIAGILYNILRKRKYEKA
ncbi:MAG: gliding motility-associated ABC transporter substrate-binding protein GldG [Bacteroidales bacterium]|nr:gliding motility-associated ABC transporter substrate-binding protein GldG [Bacteroidales bacterium]MBN2762181.1 gliding motility-associated ABC transporter substrate-binding protein GldG [Bacteroidales bacterium]